MMTSQLGEGAAVTLAGFARTDPGVAAQLGELPFLVRFAPGVGHDAGLAAIAYDIKGLPNPFVPPLSGPRPWSAWRPSRACRSPCPGCWP